MNKETNKNKQTKNKTTTTKGKTPCSGRIEFQS
jgi:hypothetical protein